MDTQELGALVAQQNASLTEFTAKHETEVADLKATVKTLEARANRPGVGVSGDDLKAASLADRSGWMDTKGNPVRVLHKSDRMATSESEIGLGDFVRAIVTGPRNEAEAKALAGAVGASGGFTVPTPLASQFIDRLRSRSVAIAAGAVTVPMDSATLQMARIESDPACDWRAENAAIAEGDPVFGRVQFQAKTLAGRVPMSRELFDDSLNVGAAVERAFTGAMGLALDRAAIYGNGAGSSPTGVWHTAGINSVAMAANGAPLANYDRILDAILELKNANAADPTAMIAAPRTEIGLAKLKNTDGDPLRIPELVSRVPLLSTTSAPVNETQGTSTDCSSIVVGDFRDLLIGMRQSLEIRIFDQPLAGTGQLLAVAWLRADVQLARPASFCRLTGIRP
jgi:HK97 family phage major capsid protein